MNNAICLGFGYVGKATAHAFGIKDWYSRSSGTVDIKHILDFKYIFICLPTPTVDGKQDLSIIEYYFSLFSEKKPDNIFIIRSTILPGTVKRLSEKYGLNIVHVPEFLSEDTWKKDSEWPDIVVVGADDEKLRLEVAGIFKGRYKGAEFVITDSVTAEMIKYVINCFYAIKVIYANVVYEYAESIGANYSIIKKAMYSRQWIGKNHLGIWDKGGRGAGGHCLEKDLEAFSNATNLALLKLGNELNKQLLKNYPKK